MLLLIDIFSINKRQRYENPSLEIIVTACCSTGGFPLEEACEHCYQNQSSIYVAISYIISVYGEDYAGYFTIILSFLAFHFCTAYFIYLVSCTHGFGAQFGEEDRFGAWFGEEGGFGGWEKEEGTRFAEARARSFAEEGT
jgi:hypothetical protein